MGKFLQRLLSIVAVAGAAGNVSGLPIKQTLIGIGIAVGQAVLTSVAHKYNEDGTSQEVAAPKN